MRVAEVDSPPGGSDLLLPRLGGPRAGAHDVRLGLRAASLVAAAAVLAFVLPHAARHPGAAARGAVRGRARHGARVQAARVARALLAAAADEARRLGLIRVCLETEVGQRPGAAPLRELRLPRRSARAPVRGVPRFVSYVRELWLAPTRPAP